MPFLLTYIIKLSVSLAVVFLFYYFILRKLTFYNHNRWYLLGYTLLCFFIPLINISAVLEKNNWEDSSVVTWIPALQQNTGEAAARATTPGFSTWDSILLIIATGILLMFIRLLIQLFSFRRLLKRAVPVNGAGMQVYQVDAPIIPFSFGNSIFINSRMHTEEELKEIIRHEFVHVKQKHSLDIIWAELLCLVSWFNPFAWLLKSAIRQNLEFIADHKVLEKGANKKEYQYLLLKVTGNRQYSIATQFNFSSLKKRIAMMNKTKSAKRQLGRLLFLLPATAVLLLAFRRHMPFNETPVPADTVRFGAIVYDDATKQPIADVLVREEISGLQTYTDESGYFSFDFAAAERKVEKHLWMMKEGYQRHLASFSVSFNAQVKEMGIIGLDAMRKGNTSEVCSDCNSSISLKDENNPARIDYQTVKDYFEQSLKNGGQKTAPGFGNNWETITDGNAIRVIYQDTIPSKAGESGLGSFIKRNPEVKSVAWRHKDNDDALHIRITRKDGTVEEYNLENETDVRRAEAKYGKLPVPPPPPPAPPATPGVVEERPIPPSAYSEIPVQGVPVSPATPAAPAAPGTLTEVVVTGYPEPPAPPRTVKLPDHVQKINVSNNKATITLKNGKTESYDLTKPEDKKKFESKYGGMIPAPPPRPASHGRVVEESRYPSASGSSSGRGSAAGNTTATVVNGRVLEESRYPSASGSSTAAGGITSAINGNPIYVVDGVETTKAGLDEISPSSIAYINVLKGDKAIASYGTRGKDGVVVISTKPVATTVADDLPITNAGTIRTTSGGNNIELYSPSISITKSDKLILVDGKELPASERGKNLKGTFNIKTLNKEEAIKKYGEKGKYGVLEITTVK